MEIEILEMLKKVGAYTNWLVKQWLGLQQKADAEHDYGTPEWDSKVGETTRIIYGRPL